jgi:3-deoxy-D-manno-octulosonic-acid transferase
MEILNSDYSFFKLKPLSELKMSDTLSDLRKEPPRLVTAMVKKSFAASIGGRVELDFHTREKHIMPIKAYADIHKDTRSKDRLLLPATPLFSNLYKNKMYVGQSLEDKSLLIIRSGGIGDTLFLQPIIRTLKHKYPSCQITLACRKDYHCMVETWEEVDRLIPIPFYMRDAAITDYILLFEGVLT